MPDQGIPSPNPMTGLTFGTALQYAKDGKLIQRSGWNGKGMFIFMRPSDEIPQSVIPNIKSLPQAVKDYFSPDGTTDYNVHFSAYLCMKAADNSIVNGWLASQTDMLSSDWQVL